MPTPAPNPPRYRWLKRLGLSVLIVVVGLVLLRGYWGHREQSQLDRLVEDARAKGYPVLFEDIQPPNIPTHDNQAAYVQQAFHALPVVNAQGQIVTATDWYNEGGAEYAQNHQLPDPVADNAAYLVQFQPVLDAMRAAATCTRSDWSFGQPISRPAFNMSVPNLSDTRRLARTIEDAVGRALAEEDYALAIEMLGHLMTIAQSLRDEPYFLIDHLVAISIRALAADLIQTVLPQLPGDPALAGPLAKLNGLWLDEDWAAHGLAKALQTELWLIFDYLEGIIDGRYNFSNGWGYTPDHLIALDYSPTRWLTRPYYQDDLAFVIRYFVHIIDAAEGYTNKQAFEDRLGSDFQEMSHELDEASDVWPVQHPLATQVVWPTSPIHKTQYRHLATSRMCAAAIALKRYTIDHGQRPDTLAALVPDYLPAVPADPFVLGRSITYLPEGGSPVPSQSVGYSGRMRPLSPEVEARVAMTFPLLYCVGDDGVDDGGLFPIREDSGRIDSRFNGSDVSTDWCYFLEELPEPIPTAASSPFHQRDRYGPGGWLGQPSGRQSGPVLPGPLPATPDSAGEEEQVDEPGDGGQGDEEEQPPAQPEQRDE